MCGEWNVHFLQDSVQLQDLHSVLLLLLLLLLLSSYNLTNTVALPTRVTKNTSSLTDAMKINKQYNNTSTEVVNLGYSDHFAQILCFLLVISHILRRNCLLQQVIEGKIKGQIEVGRRRKKLLDDLKDRRGYCQLKEEALDRTMWRNRFGRGFGPVV